jgi:hypothetical protein
MRAKYGSALIPKLSEDLTKKHGPGFSERTLRKMRHFYLLNPIRPTSAKLDWSYYVELMPVRDERTRKRLEERVLKENLDSQEIRRLVHSIRHGSPKQSLPGLPPLRRPADLKLHTFSQSPLKVKLKDNEVLIPACRQAGTADFSSTGRLRKRTCPVSTFWTSRFIPMPPRSTESLTGTVCHEKLHKR